MRTDHVLGEIALLLADEGSRIIWHHDELNEPVALPVG